MSEEATRQPSSNLSALPVGTRLGEFELLSVLGIGGFGIVYLAFDHALEREVAIKEYMPAALAGRTATMHVSIRSQDDAESFALGLRSFVNEARLLAKFNHPSLLKVHRFWEGNGTAYMAMPVLKGRNVKDVRLDMSFPPDEAWLRGLLDPLLGALEKLHSEGVYHRDIAPDNIQIEEDGRPVLLDFGAARRVLTDKSQALTAILKPAYAPIEQYGEAGAVKQGPWTDIYALGATLHFLLLTHPPAPATARAIQDEPSSLTTAALPGCSENFLRIIDWMLAPRPADRPQSVAALRDVLEGRVATPLRRAQSLQETSDWDRTVIAPAGLAAGLGRTTRPPVMPVAPPPTVPPAAATVPPPNAAFAASAPSGPVAPVWPPPEEDEDATVILPSPALGRTQLPARPPAAPLASVSDMPTLPPAALPAHLAAVAAAAPPAPLAPVAPAAYADPGEVTIRVPPPSAAATATTTTTTAATPAADTKRAAADGAAKPKSKLIPIIAGLVAVVIGVAVVFGMGGKKPAEPDAAAIAAAPPSALPAAPAAPPAAASAVPESQVATVVAPAGGLAPQAVPSPGNAAPGSGANAPPKAAAAGVAAKTAANKPGTGASPVIETPSPIVSTSPVPNADANRPRVDPTPAPASAAVPTATGPEARCGGRSTLSYFVCMEKECLKADQQGHADCKKWRQNARTDPDVKY